MIITIRGLEIQLLAQKLIYIPQERMLVIADMHLGKLIHFRREGIFVPSQLESEDLLVLQSLIDEYQPSEVVFLGDLFHSEINSDYDRFLKMIQSFPDVKFTLTKGNHDIIPRNFFKQAQVEITEEKVLKNDIVLRHQSPKKPLENHFYVIGHIHPGYLLKGRGRQIYRFPCFYQSKNLLVLPAFGTHTGLYIPELLPEDKSYVIMNEEIILMKERV